MPESDPNFDALALSIVNKAFNLERNIDALVKEVFITISRRVISHTPLWSGQAKLNWTAHLGQRAPARRFVNVQRTNVGITRNKVSGGNQGHRGNIDYDPTIAATANVTALRGVLPIANSYRHPVLPNRRLPPIRAGRSRPLPKKGRGRAAPKLFLSNSLDYIGTLWGGTWPSNPRTIEQEIEAGRRVVRKFSGTLLEPR